MFLISWVRLSQCLWRSQKKSHGALRPIFRNKNDEIDNLNFWDGEMQCGTHGSSKLETILHLESAVSRKPKWTALQIMTARPASQTK